MTKSILLLQNCVFFKMSDGSEHSESKLIFTIQASCPMQNYFSRQLTPKVNTPRKWGSSQLSQKPTSSKHAVKKTTFWMNCAIINLWNKQTVLRGNLFQWKTSKKISRVKSKKSGNAKKTKYDINVFVEFPVSGRIWLNQRNHKNTLCTVV